MSRNPLAVVGVVAIAALLLARGALAARVPGSPFPVCARGLNASSSLSVLFTDGLSRDDQLLALTLQGVLSRRAPRMYRMAARGSDYELWLNATAATFGVALDFSHAKNLAALLSTIGGGEVTGYALCALDDNSTNVALAAAAAEGVVAVTAANEQTAVAAGLTRKYDLRGKDVEWAIETFNSSSSAAGFTFSRGVAVLQDPSKLCMGDYAIASAALQFWSPVVSGSPLVADVLASMQPPFAVLGWGPDGALFARIENRSKRARHGPARLPARPLALPARRLLPPARPNSRSCCCPAYPHPCLNSPHPRRVPQRRRRLARRRRVCSERLGV
jgi:hypothetical protein